PLAYSDRGVRYLASFPTRRSSDLIGVGRAVDVQDVARVHPHRAPHPPLGQAHAVRTVQQSGQGGLLLVEVAGALLQLVEDFVRIDRKSTRLDSSHVKISYAVFC